METIGEEINKDGDEVRQERRIRRLHGEKNIWVRIKGRAKQRQGQRCRDQTVIERKAKGQRELASSGGEMFARSYATRSDGADGSS